MTEKISSTIKTSVAEIIYHPDSCVMEVHINEDAHIDVKEIKEMQAAQLELAENQTHVTLVCFKGNFITPTKEAREHGAMSSTRNVLAIAIVVRSLPLMLIIKSYIFFNKPKTPTQMFRSKNRALSWLEKMRNKPKN
jgi:hypothetical protein